MNPDSQFHYTRRRSDLENSPTPDRHRQPPPAVDLDVMQRDRFELLSAYLDGEVTAAERQQVEAWLDSDADVQRLYKRLLKLRQGIQSLSLHSSEQPRHSLKQSTEQTIEQVLRRLDRRPKLSWIYGGATAAVLCILALFPQFFERQIADPNLALQSEALNREEIIQALLLEEQSSATGPSIGLDNPVISPPALSSDDAGNPLQK